MTPRLSIIAASIRRLIAAIGGTATATASDYYWDNVVLAMKMDTGVDPEWGNTVLAMHMDDTSFVDLKSHNITSVGTPSLSAAQSKFGGKSALFNGTTDYLTIPTSTDFGFGTGDFTVECWVKTATSGTVLDLRSSSGEIGLFAISGGFISLWNGSIHLQGFTNVTTDAWVHLAWVRSAGFVSMFVNGVLDGVSATSATFGTASPVRIGADITAANFFSGYIDDLRVSKVARYADEFTPSAVPFLDDTAVPFLEEKGKAVTVVGNTSVNTTAKQYGTGSGYFDGIGDYLELADHADYAIGTGDFTIEMWFNMSAYPSSGSAYVLVSKYSGAMSRWLLYLGNNLTDDSGLKFGATDASTAINAGSTDATVTLESLGIVTNTWHHVAAVRQSGKIYVYLNGSVLPKQPACTYDVSYIGAPIQVGTQNALIPFNGYIDDLRITKGVAKYISNFTPAELATNKRTYLDPHWDKVVLGLHMDGADNGTVFTDVKGKTIVSVGGVVTKTNIKKFGSASMKVAVHADYLSIGSAPDLSSGDYTIEFWVYLNQPFNIDHSNILVATDHVLASRWLIDVGHSSGQLNVRIATPLNAVVATYQGPHSLGTWAHIAYVNNTADSSFKVFLNGTQIGSRGLLALANSGPLLVGRNSPSWVAEAYYIDDLRITKGVARYTANFQPVQLPFPEKAYNPVPYVSDPHWNNVVLAMHMDGADNGVVFTDVKGKTVTPTNAVTKQAVKMFGTASAYFDGTGDSLSIPVSSDFQFGSGNFTIEGWICPSTVTGTQTIFFYGNNSNTDDSVFVWLSSSQLQGQVGIGATLHAALSVPLVAGVWVHFAFCRIADTLKMYVNGVPGIPATTLGTSTIGIPGISPVVNIGSLYNSTTYNYSGYIDDLRITKGVARYTANFQPVQLPFPENYSGSLTIESDPYWNNVVLAMHMDGADNGVVFTDVKGKTVTPTSAVIKTATKKFGTASAYFDGAGDYLTVDNSNDFAFGTDDFTIECWVYALSIPTASNKFAFLITHDSIGITRGWELFLNDVTGPLGFLMFSDNTTYKTVMDTNPFPLNEWNHIAVSKNGPNLRLFRNGNMVAIDTTSNITIQNPNVSVLIGSNRSANVVEASGNWNFNGYIDDLRVTRGVARYTSDFTPRVFPFPNS